MWVPDPDHVETTQLTAFTRFAEGRADRAFESYRDLLAWSTDDLDGFWGCVWDFFDIVAETRGDTVLADDSMPGATWFPGARLNLVDQVFRDRPDDEIAIHERDETGRRVDITWAELRAAVASVSATLREHGVGVGDRVVAYLPNSSEAVIAFLATAALGAIWSACGMDYAPTAALGRFAQLEPVVLFAADGYRNGGRVHDRSRRGRGGPRRTALAAGDHRRRPPRHDAAGRDAVGRRQRPRRRSSTTTPVDFAHPLWVLFSSGTTGLPKGIVHGHGGVLLEHLKAVALQCDLGPGDRFWWYTTPSWMMWNFQVAGLLVGATIVCYDGSPAHPTTDAVWALAAELGVKVLGTSPAYLAACAKAGVDPGAEHDLSALCTLGVTGSTLPTPAYHWVAEHVGASVQIASITGGTDVVTAFAGGAPSVPVWAGEISTAYLGAAIDSLDENGRSVRDEVGELVITRPMPSMPVMFWNDPDGTRYHDAYFDAYPGIWRHGDFVTITDRGTLVMHGRSDATLNRNGIRMGSADIYEAVEQLPEITEALVIGIDQPDGGYWMPLFVTLEPGSRTRRRVARTDPRHHPHPRLAPARP